MITKGKSWLIACMLKLAKALKALCFQGSLTISDVCMLKPLIIIQFLEPLITVPKTKARWTAESWEYAGGCFSDAEAESYITLDITPGDICVKLNMLFDGARHDFADKDLLNLEEANRSGHLH